MQQNLSALSPSTKCISEKPLYTFLQKGEIRGPVYHVHSIIQFTSLLQIMMSYYTHSLMHNKKRNRNLFISNMTGHPTPGSSEVAKKKTSYIYKTMFRYCARDLEYIICISFINKHYSVFFDLELIALPGAFSIYLTRLNSIIHYSSKKKVRENFRIIWSSSTCKLEPTEVVRMMISCHMPDMHCSNLHTLQ